tara:strand:+ start:249 stop:470 length:222 start_codon:yes stop_codon:yes gene_type:complete
LEQVELRVHFHHLVQVHYQEYQLQILDQIQFLEVLHQLVVVVVEVGKMEEVAQEVQVEVVLKALLVEVEILLL